MPTSRSFAIQLLLAASSLAPSLRAQSQNPPGAPPQGVSREQMWFAPTAEDWKKPCLVQWQRSYEDALAVSTETGKPILICVNMDGEPASEHYAGVRYRRPETADLYKPYVCVIASVYRHTPRDYDEQGNRILCPRFGSVTCGEHIAIEPGLYDKYFDGKRVAPRHIGVDLEKSGAEMYDVYYAFDTDTIFDSLRKGVEGRPVKPEIPRGDRPILERVDSRDNEDRTAVELAYARGDRALRKSMLEVALRRPDTASVDLLRLAVRGFDLEITQMARRGLAQATTESSVDLIAEALRVPMEASERDALVAALARLGETSQRAKTLATVYQGLAGRASVVDVASWSKAIEGLAAPQPAAVDGYSLGARVETRANDALARPDDPVARAEYAAALLELALGSVSTPKYERLAFLDAQRVALEAEKLGAKGWNVDATLAVAASRLGQTDDARARAEAAVAAMPADSAAAASRAAFTVLSLFAESRQRAIAKAWRDKTAWPAQWLTDVNATYAVLEKHPLATDAQVVAHYDFLRWLGGAAQASRVLDDGLARFPESWTLHDRLRSRILSDKGVAGLESTYETMLAEKIGWPNLEWFAGYASLTAAEFHKRAGHAPDSLAAYERAIAHYERGLAANQETRASADHYIALALAGEARIAFEQGDVERSLAKLLASFERKPDAAATLDGLNLSPVDTAKMLLVKLKDDARDDLAATLQGALDHLDPELLKLPAYESQGPTGAQPGARRRP